MTEPMWSRRVAFTGITIVGFYSFLFACVFAQRAMTMPIFRGSSITLIMMLGVIVMIGSVAITTVFTLGNRQPRAGGL